MKLSTIIHKHFRTAALGGMLLAAGSASAISLTSKHTGSWFNPNQDGQGFAIEVVPGATANEKQAVVYWYTFDANGNPTWFFGAGPIQGNQANVTLYSAQGGTMGEAGQADKQEWGSMQLDFSSCDHGEISYQSAQASGNFTIERITSVFGDVCTGTLVDDVSDDQTAPEQILQELYANAGQGRGMTELEVGPNRSSFSIEVYDLPEGSYDVVVGGEVRGQITVMAYENSTRGELEFDSPARDGRPLLDFDPRGMDVAIQQAGQTLLSTTMPQQADTPNDSMAGNPPPFGNSEMETYLDRMSSNPDMERAVAKAELDQESDSVEFEVKMENAPAGAYELYVAGELRGVIEVTDLGSVSKGRIRFHYPEIAGYELLDFDPTGEIIQIMDAAGTVFEGLMEDNGSSHDQSDDNSSDDDHNGDSSDDDQNDDDHNGGGSGDDSGDHNGDDDQNGGGNPGDDSGDHNGDDDQNGGGSGDDDCTGMNCGG